VVHSKIIDALNSDKLVFFIGSGFSKTLRFPNWKELVIKFLDDLSTDYKEFKQLKEFYMNSDFMEEIEVLDKIVEHKPRVLKILDKQFSVDIQNQNLDRQNKIGRISSKIITTNYDKALELANPSFKKNRI
jgi:cell division septum initiation protein DivIVA